MLHRLIRKRRIAVLLLVVASMTIGQVKAAEQKYWELSPYRVQLHVAVDDAQAPQPGLGEELVGQLERQIRGTVYPLWRTKVKLAAAAEQHRLLARLDTLDQEYAEAAAVEELIFGCDKQMFLTVEKSLLGVTLRAREFDCLTRRWGAVQQRTVRQGSLLSVHCFDLVCQTFSPLATIRPVQDNEKEVILRFRGGDLPQQVELDFLTRAGEAFQPLMVRTNSAGEVKADTIRDISWTYLTLAEQQEDGWHAAVHTGTRRPFGVRRRGRVEHLALALREPVGSTRVRFYARHDATRGLTGYEVFRREPVATKSEPLGLTDSDGAMEVEQGDSKVALLFLRSEGQLLAKVPVVPGAAQQIEVPVADDTARLRAQATLTSLTERLIDTVAQRNILIARVRDRLKNGDIDQAQELFLTLDSLPGRAQFDKQIRSAENRKLNRSDDPKVQARIEKLFADTRKLLGRFLNTKQISELQGELTAARRGKTS